MGTLSGLEDPSLLPCPRSKKCGSPRENMTNLAQLLSTESALKRFVRAGRYEVPRDKIQAVQSRFILGNAVTLTNFSIRRSVPLALSLFYIKYNQNRGLMTKYKIQKNVFCKWPMYKK